MVGPNSTLSAGNRWVGGGTGRGERVGHGTARRPAYRSSMHDNLSPGSGIARGN